MIYRPNKHLRCYVDTIEQMQLICFILNFIGGHREGQNSPSLEPPPFLDIKTASTIATSIVHSKLDYCNSLLLQSPQLTARLSRL